MTDRFTQFSFSCVTKSKCIRVIFLFNYKYDYNISSVHEIKQIKNAAKKSELDYIRTKLVHRASTRSSIC